MPRLLFSEIVDSNDIYFKCNIIVIHGTKLTSYNNLSILTKHNIIINLNKEVILEEHIANNRKQIDQYKSQDSCQYNRPAIASN